MSQGEQRALASFLAGHLPAGQLDAALRQAREAALAAAAARQTVPAPMPTPALQPA